MKTRVSFRYFVTGILWIPFSGCNSPQTALNLIFLAIAVTVMPLTLFSTKIMDVKLEKKDKTCLIL